MILDSGTPLVSSREIALTAEFPVDAQSVQRGVKRVIIGYRSISIKPEARTGSSSSTWRLEISAGSFS